MKKTYNLYEEKKTSQKSLCPHLDRWDTILFLQCSYLGVKGLRNNGFIIFLAISVCSGISFNLDPRLILGHCSFFCGASGKLPGVCETELFCNNVWGV